MSEEIKTTDLQQLLDASLTDELLIESALKGTARFPLAQLRKALDIPHKGYEYSPREIPFSWAELQAKARIADWSGLRVGDYKDIILNGSFLDVASNTTKTLNNAQMRMELSGIDSYYHYGDTDVPHQLDFISRDCIPGTLMYNATNTNSGSYIGSALFNTLNGASGIIKLLPADVSAVIIEKRGLTETKTGANATGWGWNNMGKLWLPTEQEVWGATAWGEHKWGCGLHVQYPIFQDGLRHIVKGNGHNGSRYYWWCASSVGGSATEFCFVTGGGYPSYAVAASSWICVPLCFRVASL